MSAGVWSGFVTAVLLVLFVYGCFWAYSSRRTKDFEEASRLALDDAPLESGNVKGNHP